MSRQPPQESGLLDPCYHGVPEEIVSSDERYGSLQISELEI